MQNLVEQLSQKTSLKKEHIQNILKLLDEGSTIPFIARYRKELSGGASDEALREFEGIYIGTKNLLERKEEVLRLIAERATLSEAIRKSIYDADSLRVLEDIYRPFKESKNTRASEAVKKGLMPLANILESAKLSSSEFRAEAKKFVKNDVKTIEDAVAGAKDILAQRYSESPKERSILREAMLKFATLETKKTKSFKEDGVFKNLAEKSEKIAYIPAYRYLAIMRAVREKELSVKIVTDIERSEENIRRFKIPNHASSSSEILFEAYQDGLKRLLLPSLEREIHSIIKERADASSIGVFGKNLTQLLMTPPITPRVVLGVDPAYVSGCKLAIIDESSNFLDSSVIYPTQPKNDYDGSKRVVLALIKKYGISSVAIGNGTGSRETQEFFAKLIEEEKLSLGYTVVSEAGASVYSASKIAGEEYPKLDVTIRGAISIADRLRDPMAALVKIDAKSLGIGEYQHDVDQKLLAKRLDDVTGDLVNRVGVDVNSASASLLSHIAGIGLKVAQNIIEYRQTNGAFKTKSELLKVKGLGKKAYEQAAGFIRIKGGKNIFDNSGIHPESYEVAKKLDLIELKSLDIRAKADELGVGFETLSDIIKELVKPGFDPREELPSIVFKKGLTNIEMLKEGSVISGVVRNITDFGAFVDIGLKNDGMIHISKMSEKRIKHPFEVLSINQHLPNIRVVAVDFKTQKVELSLV